MVIHTLFAVWLFLAPPAAAKADPNSTCLSCHGVEGMTSEKGADIYVDAGKFGKGVHGSFTCDTCHADIKGYPHPKTVQKVDCSTCHADQVKQLASSVHGKMRRNGDPEAPTCQNCHGVVHYAVPASDPASSVSKKNLPDTCATCHSDPAFLSKHNIPFAKPVEAYRMSVHGRAVLAGNENAATCSDCHGSHQILPPSDQRSRISHWNVPSTCGTCHQQIKSVYMDSVHGQAMVHGSSDSPVCTDCHGEHMILAPSQPNSTVNPTRVSTVTCGRCHANERLDTRYNLPANRVPTFEDSYHGLAMQEGVETVANCASCHGVHNIYPSSDSRSTVSSANLAATCGKCHSGAGTRFSIGPIHVAAATAAEHPVVRWIRLFYLGVIPLTLGFMLLHNALDFLAKLVRGHARHEGGEQVERMNLPFRITHWLVILSFPTLVVTGFALKYPNAAWVKPLMDLDGLFALRGTVHRVAAVVLLAALVFHFIHLLRSRRDRAMVRHMLPRIKDMRDLTALLRFNLGLSPDRPTFSKFNYIEKVEYWAFIWGMAVMTLSGFMLWFINFTLRHFPKWAADAATAVHFYEAVLASLAILIWHFYFVIFDPEVYPMDRAWLTGKVPAEHLKERRPAYYLALISHGTAEAEKDVATEEQKAGKPAEAAHMEDVAGTGKGPKLGLPEKPRS